MKSTSGINDGSYFQSPSNPKQPPHFHNPSTDFNPNSVTEISYNPYVCNHHKKFSEFYEGNESHDLLNKSNLFTNENNKAIFLDYVGEYRRDTEDRLHIEKIASPISQVPSHRRLNELSSVTEEAIDTFEQSKMHIKVLRNLRIKNFVIYSKSNINNMKIVRLVKKANMKRGMRKWDIWGDRITTSTIKCFNHNNPYNIFLLVTSKINKF